MMVALKKALTEALRQLQEQPRRHAARDARGQDPRLRQVQGDPARLSPGASRASLRAARRPRAGGAAPDALAASRVALSGGRDSAVLLDALAAVASAARRTLVAVHVHHGLSPHADAWARFLRERLCAARRAARRATRRRCRARRGRASRPPRAPRATPHWPRWRTRAAHAPSRSRTIATTRPRRCCCSSCAARGRAGSPAMPRAARRRRGVAWLRPLLDVPRGRHRRATSQRARLAVGRRRQQRRHRATAAMRCAAPSCPLCARSHPAIRKHACARGGPPGRGCGACSTSSRPIDAAAFHDGRTLARAALQALLAASRPQPPALVPARARPARTLGGSPGCVAHSALRGPGRRQRAPAPCRPRRSACIASAFTPMPYRRRPSRRRGPAARRWRCLTGSCGWSTPPGRGIDLARLFAAGVTVRSRHGGERLRPGPDRPSRALKNMLREAALAPWERAAVPLVFAAGALAVVPGVAVDAAYQPQPGAEGGRLVWSPAPDR